MTTESTDPIVVESDVTAEVLQATIADLTVAGISQNRNFSNAMDPLGIWRNPERRARLDRIASILGMVGFTLSLLLAVISSLQNRSVFTGFAFAAAFLVITYYIRRMPEIRERIFAWTDRRIAAKMNKSLAWLTEQAPLQVRYTVSPERVCETEWIKDGEVVRTWTRKLGDYPICYTGRTGLFLYATEKAQKCQAVLITARDVDRERIASALGVPSCSVDPG